MYMWCTGLVEQLVPEWTGFGGGGVSGKGDNYHTSVLDIYLYASACSRVCLCALSGLILCALLSTSVCSLVDLCVYVWQN